MSSLVPCECCGTPCELVDGEYMPCPTEKNVVVVVAKMREMAEQLSPAGDGPSVNAMSDWVSQTFTELADQLEGKIDERGLFERATRTPCSKCLQLPRVKDGVLYHPISCVELSDGPFCHSCTPEKWLEDNK